MAYGVIEYNGEGQPKCEICGLHFNRVISHVRQKHGMREKEYKKAFGFDLHKGICSDASSALSREKTMSNYGKCVSHNLIVLGVGSRFKKGSAGRTKDKVSMQTKIMLKARLKQPYMIAAMSESGRRVGKSGLGNAAKYSKKSEGNDS